MRIGMLGTGTVGQTLATKLVEIGHEVRMGSRSTGNEKAVAWTASAGDAGSEGDFADAAGFGELVVNATAGTASLAALEHAGAANLDGKVLLDVANALDFSAGFPPRLAVASDSSLAEQIQAAFPGARVVKSLNTVNARVMVAPAELGEATHLFVCGNDHDAKATVIELLESFGWLSGDILDLGDLSAARGMELYLPLWLSLLQKRGDARFNIRVVH